MSAVRRYELTPEDAGLLRHVFRVAMQNYRAFNPEMLEMSEQKVGDLARMLAMGHQPGGEGFTAPAIIDFSHVAFMVEGLLDDEIEVGISEEKLQALWRRLHRLVDFGNLGKRDPPSEF